MIRFHLVAFALLAASAPAIAQDIGPAISPGQAAEGSYYRSRMTPKGAKARSAQPRPGSRALQRKACANRPLFRKQHGVNDPRVRKLEALCVAAGF